MGSHSVAGAALRPVSGFRSASDLLGAMAGVLDAIEEIVCGLGPADGLGTALWAAMKARMSASSPAVERWTLRRICFSVSSAKNVSVVTATGQM